eukprot:CAMPEP_0195525326 /NCGR_PEP_ID=MMETSP0794_2-20130614/25733_1 /TAXON_ID=515487 /ORGANISM="Stephanopyxis turris, Strain CCMP 815" /LENGTH=322 /DNA_ID=CAMNT_0040655769 /DNA_START=43 /DNA_END=1011 /DNA_ORIENTATION=+
MMAHCTRRVASTVATATTAVTVAFLSFCSNEGTSGSETSKTTPIQQTTRSFNIHATSWQQQLDKNIISSRQSSRQQNTALSHSTYFPRLWMASSSPSLFPTAKCEAMTNAQASTPINMNGHDEEVRSNEGMDYYYKKLNPNDIERTSLLDSHAIFGALCGDGLIERYNVYRRVNLENQLTGGRSIPKNKSERTHDELTVVDLKLGGRLNGHGGIVHGGVISLIFDEAMGWANECLQAQDIELASNGADTIKPSTIIVTANLNVDFRAPLVEGSEAVVRVYHDGTDGRKVYFSATLESKDGTVLFAEAKGLFIRISSDKIKNA